MAQLKFCLGRPLYNIPLGVFSFIKKSFLSQLWMPLGVFSKNKIFSKPAD
jgi:hypothetical protein